MTVYTDMNTNINININPTHTILVNTDRGPDANTDAKVHLSIFVQYSHELCCPYC